MKAGGDSVGKAGGVGGIGVVHAKDATCPSCGGKGKLPHKELRPEGGCGYDEIPGGHNVRNIVVWGAVFGALLRAAARFSPQGATLLLFDLMSQSENKPETI